MPEVEDPSADLERRNQALQAKREFEAFIRGSAARVDMLPRGPIKGLGFAVADLMLMKILNGTVKPKSAKEAIDVAKGALDIARREAGESDTTVTISTPEQREIAIARAGELYAKAKERQALESGDDPEITDAEVVDDDVVAGTAAGSVPQSSPTRIGVRRVRAS